ncbi:MAG: hypothetical protein E6J43_09095 [Chloroflexi bacterium]|nr:MAG: hypothetical protein E6J43_09095 [Chloroflexota bacterium]
MRGRGNSCYGFRADTPAARGRVIARTASPPIPVSRFVWLLGAIVLAALGVLLLTFGPLKAYAVNETGAGLPAAVPANPSASAPDCPDGYVLDFAGLPTGTILGEQYASLGVHISGSTSRTDLPDAIVVFNSNGTGSHDPDLEVHIGNIAILANNLSDKNGDGLVDFPDENNYGGKQVYQFDSPVHIGSFLFIDKDHGTPERATAYDADGNVVSSVPIPVGANASVQTIDVNADDAVKLEIRYRDSGALTDIQVCPAATTTESGPSPTPKPHASSSGTTNQLVTIPRTVKTQSLSLPSTAVLPAAMPRTGGDPEPRSATATAELAAGLLALVGACLAAGLIRRTHLR